MSLAGFKKEDPMTSASIAAAVESYAAALGCLPPIEAQAGSPDPVLLVTKREIEQTSVRRLLSDLGYPVLVAAGGTAVHIVEQHHRSLHLLLTDAFVPGRPGLTLVESITPYRSELPVLMMVEDAEDLAPLETLHHCPTAAIHKPVTRSTLADGIVRAREIQHELEIGAISPSDHPPEAQAT